VKKASIAFLLICAALSTQAQSNGVLDLQLRAVHRRAVEAVIWGMPAVNCNRMYDAMVDAGGAFNQIALMPRLQNWRNQTLTPNADVIYLMPFINTRDAGPMVLEIPPADEGSITGTITDWWQSALEDVGPIGADKGIGGKYLILPPNYQERIPADYIVLRSYTYQTQALLRSIPRSGSDTDIAAAVRFARHIKLYRLSQAANPPPTKFIDVADVVFDATIPFNVRFFESLDRVVQTEPWLRRDKLMIDMLKSIGIEKGQPFRPDARTREVLNDAAREARDWLNARYEAEFKPYFNGTQWGITAPADVLETQSTFYEKQDKYAVNDRALAYFSAFSSVKHVGIGQFYLFASKDKQGRELDGGSSYHLNVPANVPAKQYWSVTVYDRSTFAFVRDVPRVSCGSLTSRLEQHADGSIEIYFGPKAPEANESNWLPTKANATYLVAFRFYGPAKPLFDKTWKLPNIEEVK